MSSQTFGKIKVLRSSAEALDTFFDRFAEITADSKCDKYGEGFNADTRFATFSASVSFDNWTGYYGSSSCGTFLRIDSGIAAPYFVKALNQHRRTILATMADLMRQDARKMTDQAREEIEAMQASLDEIDGLRSTDAAAA